MQSLASIYQSIEQQKREDQAEDDLQDYVAGQSDGYLGIDSEEYSLPYLQGYVEGAIKARKELEKQLQEILDIAQKNRERLGKLQNQPMPEEF